MMLRVRPCLEAAALFTLANAVGAVDLRHIP